MGDDMQTSRAEEPRRKTCPDCFSQRGYSGIGSDFECWDCGLTSMASRCTAERAAHLRASREGQSVPTLSDQPSTDVPERLGPDTSS